MDKQNTYKMMPRKSGSTLILVITMTTILSFVALTLIRFGISERRLNKSSIVYNRAQNAAESMVEYGFAELKSRWSRQTSFSRSALIDDPLVIPPTALEFFGEEDIAYEEFEIVGGLIPPGERRFIDPKDPLNTNDPQKGKLVFARDVRIFGKAVATDSIVGRRAAYCEQTLMIRDAPLFSHAIFYNMDLEFHPGPEMDMQGPVHANGDIYIQAVRRLRFHSTLMSSGDIIYGSKFKPGKVTQKGAVLVKDGSNSWVSFHKGGSKSAKSNYYDSDMGGEWRNLSTNRWDGNVGSVDHGVPKMNPIGIQDYIPDDLSTPENEKFNPAYALIEPLSPIGHPNFKGDEVMKEKFAYKAGLIFRIEREEGTPSANEANEQNSGYTYKLNAYKYTRAQATDPTSSPVFADNSPQMIDLDLNAVQTRIGQDVLTINPYSEDENGLPIGGFYDRRQQLAMDVIELDVGLLADLIAGEEINEVTDPWDGKYTNNPGVHVDWNGIVYIELPYDSSPSDRADRVMPADRDIVLRLNNASRVPNPEFATAANIDPGFTLATNGQLYVKGHFNSDGRSQTGSSTRTDDGLTFDSSEATAAIFADSITVLSSSFDDSRSKLSPRNRRASYTEISAGFVTGLLPTEPGQTAQSGGAHNLPRFLEDWNRVEFRYRGSLVALYESESGIMPMNQSHSAWYRPPKRNWGYNALFADGIYPPGTPNTRDYRRTDFRFMARNEYEDALLSLDGFDPLTSPRGQQSNICALSGFDN